MRALCPECGWTIGWKECEDMLAQSGGQSRAMPAVRGVLGAWVGGILRTRTNDMRGTSGPRRAWYKSTFRLPLLSLSLPRSSSRFGAIPAVLFNCCRRPPSHPITGSSDRSARLLAMTRDAIWHPAHHILCIPVRPQDAIYTSPRTLFHFTLAAIFPVTGIWGVQPAALNPLA